MLKKTIDQILPGTAARLPDKTALIFGDRTFTYRQLERLTNQAANGLKGLGVKKGDRVTLFAQNSAEWVHQLYRHCQGRRRDQSGQCHADRRRTGLRRQGLRR